jgi:hypothetical protein
MDLIKKEIKNNPDKVVSRKFLELAKKDSRGVPVSTGVHKVKLLRGEEQEKENYRGIVEEGIMLYFDENGSEKQYFVPKFVSDKNSENYGNFHYLYERFADIEEGEEIEMEFIKSGKIGYIDVRKLNVADDSIPAVEEEEEYATGGYENN